MGGQRMQIGEVAARTELSLRTIRHYDEVGLVVPSARTQGGFRLYTEIDVARLMVIRRMKPLGFTLEQMQELLAATDRVDSGDPIDPAERGQLLDTVREFEQAAQQRCDDLRTQLERAEEFAATLRRRLSDTTTPDENTRVLGDGKPVTIQYPVVDLLPRIDRPEVGLVVLGEWRAASPGTQHAVVDAAVAQGQRLGWPAGLLSHTVFAGSDGCAVVHYSQATDEETFKNFTSNPQWAAGVDAVVPGVQRLGAKPYRLYRSVRTATPGEAGCVVIVRFTTETAEHAAAWVDALLEAGRGDDPPAGMLSAHFHISLDGTSILNYAEWVDSASHESSVQARPQHADSDLVKVVDETPGVRFVGFDRFPRWRSVATTG
jgi:DNA-binding transcriptional MerR regulator